MIGDKSSTSEDTFSAKALEQRKHISNIPFKTIARRLWLNFGRGNLALT